MHSELQAKANHQGWQDRPEGWEEVNDEYVQDILSFPDHLDEAEEDLKTLPTDFDIIFVLAGGLNKENRNHQWVVRRLNLAARLWKFSKKTTGKSRQILCLGGGTYHKPSPRNHQGFVMHESTVCAQYLISIGIPHNHIMREWSSYDTIANGWFALTNYAMPFNYHRIIIITSDFHMARTRAIFTWLWRIAGRDPETELWFVPVSSDGLDPQIIAARNLRETRSLTRLQETIDQINDLPSFAYWFYHDHQAYNCEVSRRSDLHRDTSDHDHVDDLTRQSY